MRRASWPFEPDVRRVIELLADGEFEALASSGRCSASDLHKAVRGYGQTIVLPPLDDAPPFDVVQVATSLSREWSVRVPLWTREDGRSDLTLELTVREQPSGRYAVEVDDLHVL